MKHLCQVIDQYTESGAVGHLAVRVGRWDDVIYDDFRGVNEQTLFDMASVTKMMATTTLSLVAIDRGLLHVDDAVSRFYPTEKPLTLKNLLTHTMGIGHKALNKEGNTYDNIAEKILEIPPDIPAGSDVKYSCPAFILLGKILEQVFGKRLDRCFDELVAAPLCLLSTCFLPRERDNIVNANADEQKKGIVNDYNCQFLGGVAGNAGLFSNIEDTTKYARFLLNHGAPLFCESTFMAAVQNETPKMSESRGLGFLYVDGSYDQTGGLFADGSIGHCGHTGQSVFVDYRTGLFMIVLSDATVSNIRNLGRENYAAVKEMRTRLHQAAKQDLEI